MAQEYLPAPSNVRLADLMKEHNISQPELAKEIGCSKSTISRFISGAKGTLTHEQVLKIARLFKVSTDFLLGETNIPDRKNYDIAELGLSVEAARNLYTGRVNTEVVNLLLENARFAELTYRIAQYFDDTFASGIAAQNAMFTTLSTLLRTKVKTPEAAKAAKDISLRRKPVYQGDLDDIEMYFMAAVKEIKKGIGSHYAEQEAMSKKVAEKMFTELTKGQDVQHPTITAEQLTDAMLDSVSGMEGATPEAPFNSVIVPSGRFHAQRPVVSSQTASAPFSSFTLTSSTFPSSISGSRLITSKTRSAPASAERRKLLCWVNWLIGSAAWRTKTR